MAFAPAQPAASPVQSITSDTTLDGSKGTVLVDATAGSLTTTLFSAGQKVGAEVRLRRMDASGNTVTIAAAASQTVDGAASVTLTTANPGRVLVAVSATAWRTVVLSA